MYDYQVNGMDLARFIAAHLLQDSCYSGKRYYDKEDALTDQIRSAIELFERSKKGN